jgi:hypothetical protein
MGDKGSTRIRKAKRRGKKKSSSIPSTVEENPNLHFHSPYIGTIANI